MFASFDDMTRRLALVMDRRSLLGVLSGSAAGSLLALHAAPGLAGKKHKGKGKNKGGNTCKKGKRPCGKGCIAKDACCEHTDCDLCTHTFCENGRCGCTGGRVRHNGVCGFVPHCKSISLICTSNNECCSGKCDIFDGLNYRCNKGAEQCIVDIDCISSNCRGYMCPEFLAASLDGVC